MFRYLPKHLNNEVSTFSSFYFADCKTGGGPVPPLKAEQPRIRSATPSSEEEVTLILLGITLQGEPLRDCQTWECRGFWLFRILFINKELNQL